MSPEEYRAVQEEFEAQARKAGADTLACVYHKCSHEWGKFASDRLAFRHYILILAEALGCPVPDRFQALWKLGDPEAVLAHTRPHWESWGIEEEEARRLVQKFFVPKYAAALPRCPCEGNCVEAAGPIHGAAPTGPELPVLPTPMR